MSRIKTIARNLRLIFSREITDLTGEIEGRLSSRADDYETALDARIEERANVFDRRIDEKSTVIDDRIEERFKNIEGRVDLRLATAELRIDAHAGERETALDARIDERLAGTELRLDQQFAEREEKIDRRLEERSRAVDNRVDDRMAKLERYIDERFKAQEDRTDERIERHELKVDGMIRQMSHDVVERNDVMLQVFEQRLDKQRRDIRSLRESRNPDATTSQSPPQNSVDTDPGKADEQKHESNGSAPQEQLISFRKLADVSTHAQTKIRDARQGSGEVVLYHQILDWKKIAHEGINVFTPDEQETVDYILSFVDDPKEVHYINQHLRRFVSTLHRIPPVQRSNNRLLELGSLSHLAPAIGKYCGYKEIDCADFWESEEKIVDKTLKQKNGPDSFTFELRNFNVERDPFPYPDGHFHAVLCCELIEHLQSDPMHMLWEANRVLEDGGFILLTTPNIASCRAIEGLFVGCAPYLLAQYNVSETVDQHNREYAPYEVGVLLAAAGFTVTDLETEDVWLRSNPAILDLLNQVKIPTELRGDNIFALARKTSAPIERYPKELYID